MEISFLELDGTDFQHKIRWYSGFRISLHEEELKSKEEWFFLFDFEIV